MKYLLRLFTKKWTFLHKKSNFIFSNENVRLFYFKLRGTLYKQYLERSDCPWSFLRWSYPNTTIDVGGTFQLTTKEDATFAGANVIADKINFDIGKDLNIISLQDESKSEGKSWGAGIDVSANIPGTNQKPGYATPSLNGSYSQDSADSKWVNNQTSIIAENGGSVKVGETLTNVGSIIGSLNSDEKLSIDANKVGFSAAFFVFALVLLSLNSRTLFTRSNIIGHFFNNPGSAPTSQIQYLGFRSIKSFPII